MTTKSLFTLGSILSFGAGVYSFSILVPSCAGHPPYTQFGILILPVSAVCTVFFPLLGVGFWKLGHKDEVADRGGGKELCRFALLSLFLSALGLVVPFLGIAGIVTGHISRRRCSSVPNLSGSRLARLSLILGYVSVLYFTYVFGSMLIVALIAG